jgi:hypothetical protein
LRHLDDRELVLVTSVTFVESMPRYSLTMFPIFMLFALVSKNRFWSALVTVWSLIFLALSVRGLVGVLKSAFYLFQSSAPFLTA